MGQHIYSGDKGVVHLCTLLREYETKDIVLFSGKSSLDNMPISKALFSSLKNFNPKRFNDISPNPTDENIIQAFKFLKNNKFDLILAIGGGSTIDTAKIANFLYQNKMSLDDYINQNFKTLKDTNNIIAIPTTAGTGSESTQFATFYIDKKKYSLDSPKILPKYVILDPGFTSTLPPDLTAQTGADALCHSIESFWNINSTQETRELAKKAIDLLINHLPLNNRKEILIAANLAGQAINQTRTTAAHSISYPMTSMFDIPHGQAVSVSIPYLFEYNSKVSEKDCLDPRGKNFVSERIQDLKKTFNTDNPKDFLVSFFKKIGLKTSLQELGIKKEDIPLLANNGFTPSRMKNNPRAVTLETLTKILNEAY